MIFLKFKALLDSRLHLVKPSPVLYVNRQMSILDLGVIISIK